MTIQFVILFVLLVCDFRLRLDVRLRFDHFSFDARTILIGRLHNEIASPRVSFRPAADGPVEEFIWSRQFVVYEDYANRTRASNSAE